MAVNLEKFMYPLLWVICIVVAGLSIAGISNAQLPQSQHFFIVILVLILFIGLLSAAAYSSRSKSNYNYEVNEEAVKPTKGRENQAFQAEEGKAAPGEKPGAQQKWVSNYVPYGDLPAGSASASVTAENETAAPAASTSNGIEQKWKKNYVPFKEGDADDDKGKE